MTEYIICGSLAGLTVDLGLFPIDTIKTRLQSSKGFWRSGNFKGIYSGSASVVVGSMPSSALFFITYENIKLFGGENPSLSCVTSAAVLGECAACIFRVPTEVVKQNAQISQNSSSLGVLKTILRSEGMFGLYRGYLSTLLRDVPFAVLQFPLWEVGKRFLSSNSQHVTASQSALAGAISGGLSAFLTTPLDVCKTRIMLQQTNTSSNILGIMKYIIYSEGISSLFAGSIPRMSMFSLGGFIFLGSYTFFSNNLFYK